MSQSGVSSSGDGSQHPYSQVGGRQGYQIRVAGRNEEGGNSPPANENDQVLPLLEGAKPALTRLKTFNSFGRRDKPVKDPVGPSSLRSISLQRRQEKRRSGSFSIGRSLSRLASLAKSQASGSGLNSPSGVAEEEEESLCRICLGELVSEAKEGEEAPLTVLKLECACKGEIGMVHQECGYTWFKYKHNRICDVCGQEVTNIPIEILSRQNTSRGGNDQQTPEPPPPAQVLVIVLIYIITFNNVMADAEVEEPVAHAVPLAVGGALFTLLITHFSVLDGNIWNYMLVQVGAVVGCTLFFYSVVELDSQLSCLLGLLVGLSLAALLCALITSDILRRPFTRSAFAPVPAVPENAENASTTLTLEHVRNALEERQEHVGIEMTSANQNSEGTRSSVPEISSDPETSPRRRPVRSPRGRRDVERGFG